MSPSSRARSPPSYSQPLNIAADVIADVITASTWWPQLVRQPPSSQRLQQHGDAKAAARLRVLHLSWHRDTTLGSLQRLQLSPCRRVGGQKLGISSCCLGCGAAPETARDASTSTGFESSSLSTSLLSPQLPLPLPLPLLPLPLSSLSSKRHCHLKGATPASRPPPSSEST